VTGNRSEVRLVPYEEAYGPGFEDTQRRVPDMTPLRALSDWAPKRTLDETLARVHQWLATELEGERE
jgi:UDP-glucose 4-epimerase